MEKFFTFIGVFIFSSILALLIFNHYDAKQKQKLIEYIRSGNVEAIKDGLKNHDMGADTVDPKNGYSFLHYAVIGGHENMIKYLIDEGAWVNATLRNGQTPLHFAVKFHKDRDYMKTISILLEHGADINRRGSAKYYKSSPLDEALKNNLTDVVELFLKQDLDQETLDRALLHAGDKLIETKRDYKDSLVKVFIERGANPNYKYNNLETPLHIAAKGGYVLDVAVLLENGANIYALDKRGKSPLYMASRSHHPRIVGFLLNNNALDEEENNILEAAVRGILYRTRPSQLKKKSIRNTQDVNYYDHRYLDTLRTILSHYKNNNLDNTTLLNGGVLAAARYDDLEGLEFLLEKGGDLFSKDEKGQTLLHYSITNRDKAVLEFLLNEKIKADIVDDNGTTPLMLAAQRIEIGSVEVLLKAGADINAQDNKGMSALHYIAPYRGDDSQRYDGDVKMIEFLLKSGANPNLKNNEGKTPLDLVAGINKEEKMRVLKTPRPESP